MEDYTLSLPSYSIGENVYQKIGLADVPEIGVALTEIFSAKREIVIFPLRVAMFSGI